MRLLYPCRLWLWAGLIQSMFNSALVTAGLQARQNANDLGQFALETILEDASPIFGYYSDNSTKLAKWMSAYPDDTKIVHMNIPGTHDTATWNYSLATQEYLDHITELVNITEYPPQAFRCQQKPIIDMLNSGIRVFDLRYALDVTNSTLVFWHGQGLQSETATIDDVMFGYYQWLNDHPTEAVFLSFEYESSTVPTNVDDAEVELLLYQALTSPAAKSYILQTRNSFGTLGEARGKITLLRRFDLTFLTNPKYNATLPGTNFSPDYWLDNHPNITLVFNKSLGEAGTAYIEDYYDILTANHSSAAENIQWKLNATLAHLRFAATGPTDSLFWSFASSENTANVPPVTPEIQALGNGTTLTPKGGVNQQLLPFFREMKGKRLGIVMFDFFDVPSDLLPTFLDILPPP